MIIIRNPENGAEIKDFAYEGVKYFVGDEIFRKDSIIKIEDDDFAQYLLGIYGFLNELSPEEAQKYANGDYIRCDKCDFKTTTPLALSGHKRKHEKEQRLADLPIPTVGKKEPVISDKVLSEQDRIDADDRRMGLVGEGLVEEKPAGKAVMK